MPCHTRMKNLLLEGLLWLYLLGFGFTVTSLEPGFLDFDNLPDTNFSCVGKVIGGYYADLETSCQMFHVCTIGQLDEPMDIRFLCLNGTVFDQETRVCERIDEVDCSKSEQFYSLNLELYGNTQPPIVEETSEHEPTEILKQSSSSTTTSTTQNPFKQKTTRPSFIITTTPKPPTTTLEQRLQRPHYSDSDDADIRFNPEEINISLNPGAPPDIIRSKPVSFQQQSMSDNSKRTIVTTHTTAYKGDLQASPSPQTTPKPKHYDEGYHYDSYQTERNVEYETEISTHNFHFRPNSFRPSSLDLYKPSTYRSQYQHTTVNPHKGGYNQRPPTTYRNMYSSPLKPSLPYYHRTEKPPRIQLPLPSLSPLTFSSPAPFSLNRHIENKRFADHHQPPRIVISASASVSDANGRKFNYSLGTIGDSSFFPQAPSSYDDYKDEHIPIDPFYHDVPKLRRVKQSGRKKRSTSRGGKTFVDTVAVAKELEEEKEAIDVLKFLFDWYNKYNKTGKTPERKSKALLGLQLLKPPPLEQSYNVSDGVVSVTEIRRIDEVESAKVEFGSQAFDYIDDNYEPDVYKGTEAPEDDKVPVKNFRVHVDEIRKTLSESNTSQDEDLSGITTPRNETSSTHQYEMVLKILGITTNRPTNTTSEANKTQAAVHYSEYDFEVPKEVADDLEVYKDYYEDQGVQIFADEQTKNESHRTSTLAVEEETTTAAQFTNEQSKNTNNLEETTTTEQVTSTILAAQEETITATTAQVTTAEVSTETTYETTTLSSPFTTESTVRAEPTEGLPTDTIEPPSSDPVETTTTSEYKTQFFTTTNALYTTVQLQKFVEDIESETIADVKYVTTAPPTTLPPTTRSTRLRGVHRFSKTTATPKPVRRKPSLTEEIVELSKSNREFNINAYTANLAYRNVEAAVTSPSFAKSANPTQPKDYLPTTPLSRSAAVFNCFGKPINRFYSDARDCRLFHYCTRGFTKTQLLDMKFVCDLGTYFDDEKLICTKSKPSRCT